MVSESGSDECPDDFAGQPASTSFEQSAVRADRRKEPWPSHHKPRSDCERELWLSFEDLRVDPGSHLTQQIVAERIGRSRTSISMGREDGYALLRAAIKAEITRRKQKRGVPTPPSTVSKTPLERAGRREGTINYYKDLEQRAVSAVVGANARAIRAEQAAELHKRALEAIFADFRSGKWTRTDGDGDGDALTRFQAFLTEALTPKKPDESGDAPPVEGVPTPRIAGVKAPARGGKSWRSFR